MTHSAVSRCLAGVCLALVSVLSGCKGDECSKGATECVSSSLYRVCIEGKDGPEWLISQCGDNEVCQSEVQLPNPTAFDAGADAGGTSTTASSSSSADVCVGTCALGERECVTDSLARFCISGGVWQLDMCDVGERCVSGECVLSSEEGAVQRCAPGTKRCASDMVEKLCDPDGTAWILQSCAANEVCTKDACAPDPSSSCDDGNVCLDNKTQVRCLGTDKGFELVACEGDTYCQGGACRGDACSVGSYCNGTVNGQAQIRECVDGVNLRDVTCKVGEVCRQNPDSTAECVKPTCKLGTTVCGDPADTKADATKVFSQCLTLRNTGVPGWVMGECVDDLTCDPSFVSGGNPCRQDCTPGAQRCAPVGTVVGVNDGFQECGDDGTWGPVMRCNPGTDSRLLCSIEQTDDPAALPRAVCAEPVCYYAMTSADAAEGTCEGARIRRCNEDGTLAAAENCELGICRSVTSTVTDDGRVPGACDIEVQCKQGEERCVDNGATATPRYQSCVDGLWSTELGTCADDTSCRDYLDDDGLSHKVCDAECVPGTRHCDGDAIQICDDKGKWGEPKDCAMGVCSTLPNEDAACTVACVPKTKRCSGTSIRASDGVHTGSDSEQICGDDGKWGDAQSCASGAACRKSASGVVLGCVECLGSDAPGGNTEGLADTRCADANKTQACGADNTWRDSVACAAGGTCVGPTPATCGACLGPDSSTEVAVCNLANYQGVARICESCTVPGASISTFLPTCSESAYGAAPDACGACPTGPDGSPVAAPCTETAFRAAPVCGGCDLVTPSSITLPECSVTAIMNAGGNNCSNTDVGGSSGAVGSTPDCCVNAQTTASAVDPSLTCNPSSWAGVSNCCESAQQSYADNNASFSCNATEWAGTSDCCEATQQSFGDWNPNGTLSACAPSPWGGETECCLAGRQGGSGPSFAYCETP